MKGLLRIAGLIDRLNHAVARWVRWLILAAVLVSAGNAVVRKTLQTSSNAFLEIQWYLFAAVFLLCAGAVMARNAHVRVDFVWSRLEPQTRSIVEIVGLALVVVPLCLTLILMSTPLVIDAWRSGEVSPNAGGLIRWPAYALVPLGMGLLLLQALAEAIRQLAFLRGLAPDPFGRRE
jgi:TRAP-type mannitol/chloroaromatic compound transport system permease small subunit